jgi:integrase
LGLIFQILAVWPPVWWLPSPLVIFDEDVARDVARLVIPLAGSVQESGDVFVPCRLADAAGAVVEPVSVFLAELQASGRAEATLRSYCKALLRWYRFLWAVEVPWDQATRAEARDFCRWLQLADKPARPHWRHPGDPPAPRPQAGVVNPVTGKAAPGLGYAASTAAHCETVTRTFYEFYLQAGSGPMVNPFPLARHGRAHAHHSPMDPFRNERAGLYRPRLAARLPRQIPDEMFTRVFAGLRSDRDRALVAFWVSGGARAAELLGATVGCADPARQVIRVIRKGSRAVQDVPACPDAFIYLALYQHRLLGKVSFGADDPLWRTLRPPYRPLTYDAARMMFTRAAATLGADYTIHDLRHTAAYRMARDPEMLLSDIQQVLGHRHLSSTQIYLNPLPEDVIASAIAYFRRRDRAAPAAGPAVAAGYNPASLNILFGTAGS